MSNHQVKLKKKEEIAEGTMAFSFEKPAGFQFKPGQFANLTLLNPSEADAGGNARTLSIASAPFEEDLMFATRMRDTAFKRVLKPCRWEQKLLLAAPSVPSPFILTLPGPESSLQEALGSRPSAA